MVSLITANIGGIDEPKIVPDQSTSFLRHDFRGSNPQQYDDRTAALRYKTLMHEYSDSELLLWIDGKIQITCFDFIQQCIIALEDGQIAIFEKVR